MKNQLLLFVCIIVQLHFCYSQQDKQWLVTDLGGKSGYNTSTGLNAYSNPIQGADIVIEGITHPNPKCNANARNDIFVIYDDGSHYNSRLDQRYGPQGFFFPATSIQDQSVNQVNHNLKGPLNKNIRFMYLSNIYEDDDPPTGVRAKSGTSGQNATPYNLDVSQPMINTITADHDIVKNTDITLVLNSASVANGDVLYFILRPWHTSDPGTRKMYFDGSPFTPGGKFVSIGELDPVSDPNNGFRFKNLPPNLPPYIYVNLRPAALLTNYFPTDPTIDPQYEIQFGIEINHNYTSKEDLRASHDPNYMQVNSVCEHANGDLCVNYHLQFVNTSFTQANELAIRCTLPDQLDLNCIGSVVWMAGGNTTGTYEVKGQEIKFTFARDATVFACEANNDPSKSIGSVDFSVKVKSTGIVKVKDPAYSLMPLDGVVSFSATDYTLDNYFDQSLVRPGTHAFNGVRNIATGKCLLCDCPKPPPPPYFLMVIGIILFLVIGFFILKRKKVKNVPVKR